jgi:predicted ArsR family transcriptional regulator
MSNEVLFTKFDNIFFEKTRLSIVTILYQEDVASFNRIKKVIGGTDGAVYTHLQRLLNADYVANRKDISGKKAQTMYSLTRKGKKTFQDYIKFLEDIISKKHF